MHVGLDDGLLSLTDLPYPCIKTMGEQNEKTGISRAADSGKRKRFLSKSPAHWGVKKKRSTRKSKIDWKSVQGSSLLDTNANEVALIELDEMLWGMESGYDKLMNPIVWMLHSTLHSCFVVEQHFHLRVTA